MQFVSRLPELMQRKGVKDQKTLAEETGLSPTTVGKIYRGDFRRIEEKTILTLYNYFGCQSINEIIEIQ
ncbi:MAG: helix-turn-helix transcriptional regulator [Coleofasciculus sp. S288]|nr:helix-turn-helix transcriptional regulator [Coleofasciculus sp. S288]